MRLWGCVVAAVVLLPLRAWTACPERPLRLDRAGFVLAPEGASALPGADGADVTLPDVWRDRRPEAGGFAWYRFDVPSAQGSVERCGLWLPDVNMNAAVYVNGQWVGDGGPFTEPVAHNFNRPLYFPFPATLLRDGGRIDVLLYAYAHHFGRLGVVWVGPHDVLSRRHARATFRQITLAQVGTALALMTILLVGTVWAGSGLQPVYGLFLGSTLAWTINSLNYWVARLPMTHWTWDRLVNGALDQFAVLLALFFHRVVGVDRPWLERGLLTFGGAAAIAAAVTPRPHFAMTMAFTHGIITLIGAYTTAVAWWYRGRLTRVEGVIYPGAWLAQLVFSGHDLGIQFGLWRGVGYVLPYTVSCMMLAFGTTLALAFIQAVREARALNRTLEERVLERETALSRQFDRTRELERREILTNERQRLMREMHDGLGGKLVSALALAEAAPTAPTELAAALRDGLDELRLVIFSLDPGLSDVTALLAALRERVEPTLERAGIHFRWKVGDAPTPSGYGPGQLLSLLRIVQEAVTNAVRHGAPKAIEVATWVEHANTLVIRIADDGCGFDPGARSGRGRTNMARRADELGGTLRVESGPDGTRVELRLVVSS